VRYSEVTADQTTAVIDNFMIQSYDIMDAIALQSLKVMDQEIVKISSLKSILNLMIEIHIEMKVRRLKLRVPYCAKPIDKQRSNIQLCNIVIVDKPSCFEIEEKSLIDMGLPCVRFAAPTVLTNNHPTYNADGRGMSEAFLASIAISQLEELNDC
jgi:hypothetical protein